MTRLSLSLAALAVASMSMACGGSDVPAQNPNGQLNAGYPPGAYPQQPGAYPQQPGAYPQQPGAYPQQPGAQPGQPAPGGTAPAGTAPGGFAIPGFPAPGGQPSGAAGGSAQALDPNVAALAVGPLTLFANGEAPGMQKDGPIIAGNFQTGQTLEGTFQFQPGKCYTLVASAVGITKLGLEMQYVTPLPGIAPTIQKTTGGSQVSLGGKANCLKPLAPFPAQAKFIVRAEAGAGMAAAQLFSK